MGGGDFRGDCASAASVGLIPVMSPIELAGTVISRRTTGLATLTVLVPLAEIADYQSRLKALTGREGAYLMELSHYDQVTARRQQELAASYRPRPNAE